MKIDTILFDLDETLYPSGNGIWQQVSARIDQYILEHFDYPSEQLEELRKNWCKKYGTTTRFLTLEKRVDLYDFLRFVHDIDLDDVLEENPTLRRVLKQIPAKKYLFTNSDRFYSTKILKKLGVLDCFDGMIDIIDMYPACKPMSETFILAKRILGIRENSSCMLVDDQPANIKNACDFGFWGIQVGKKSQKIDQRAGYIARIEDLEKYLELSDKEEI